MNIETCNLIVITPGTDDSGFQKDIETKIEDVFCEEYSIRMTEFYSSQASDIKPRIILELRVEDWDLSKHKVGNKMEYASKVEYDECIYDVIRTFRPKNQKSKIQVVLG